VNKFGGSTVYKVRMRNFQNFRKILFSGSIVSAAVFSLTGCDLFGPRDSAYGAPGYQGDYYANQPQPSYAPPGYDAQAPAYGHSDTTAPVRAGAGQGYGAPQPQYGAPAYGGPDAGMSGSPAAITGEHTVQSGDTLWGISRQYGTTVTAIKQANGLTSDVIRPGEVLQIPGSN
jgi:nucleoid-associated protein YgaU